MRSFLLVAAAFVAFAATMTFEATDANAVVCARGVYRAGCAGARGAVVVKKPAVFAAAPSNRRVCLDGDGAPPLPLWSRRAKLALRGVG